MVAGLQNYRRAIFRVFPSAAAESTLSRILQETVPEKYYLSQKACQGILRRAAARGKELPEMREQRWNSRQRHNLFE
jgi:hypothetical protein